MVKLYGVARSRATRAIWLMNEIGMAYELVPVIQAYRLADPSAPSAPLNTRSPSFLALSPAGTVPVLEDEGLVLSESVAINMYLAQRYGGALGPRDRVEEALMLQWGFYGITAIEADALVLLFAPAENRAANPDVLAARARLDRPLKVLNDHLAREGHLVGRRFTVADINMAEMVRYAAVEPGILDGYPAIRAWLSALHERAAFKAMWALRLAEPE